MKSLYSEEIPVLLSLIEHGIKHRVETVGPDETVGLLEFIKKRMDAHNGEYIRIPLIPFDITKVDRNYLMELFSKEDIDNDFYGYLMDPNWSQKFKDLMVEEDDDSADIEPDIDMEVDHDIEGNEDFYVDEQLDDEGDTELDEDKLDDWKIE